MPDNLDKLFAKINVKMQALNFYFPGRFSVFANLLRFRVEQQQNNNNAYTPTIKHVLSPLSFKLSRVFLSIFPLYYFDLDLSNEQIHGCSYPEPLFKFGSAIKPFFH